LFLDATIEQENILQTQSSANSDTRQNFPHIVDQLLTPELNESESNTNTETLPQATDEPVLAIIDEVRTTPMNETVSEVISEMVTQTMNEVLPSENDKIPSEITNEETSKPTPPSSSPPPQFNAYSPVLPPLDDDPVLFSIESPQIPVNNTSDLGPQDYIIIVPCSDDEDDFDDNLINDKQNNTINKESDTKTIESLSSPFKTNTCPTLIHPSLSRGKLFIVLLNKNFFF
jgi:hypothetical protein